MACGETTPKVSTSASASSRRSAQRGGEKDLWPSLARLLDQVERPVDLAAREVDGEEHDLEAVVVRVGDMTGLSTQYPSARTAQAQLQFPLEID